MAPLVEEPPPLIETEGISSLPLPHPEIRVGGRLAHFAETSFQRKTNFVPGPCLLPAASRSAAGRGSRQPSIKGGSGANNSAMFGILFQNFSSSQEERKTQADNRPLCTQQFCRHSELQNRDTEKSEMLFAATIGHFRWT